MRDIPHERSHVRSFCLYGMYHVGKFREAGSRLASTKVWQRQERRLLNGLMSQEVGLCSLGKGKSCKPKQLRMYPLLIVKDGPRCKLLASFYEAGIWTQKWTQCVYTQDSGFEMSTLEMQLRASDHQDCCPCWKQDRNTRRLHSAMEEV